MSICFSNVQARYQGKTIFSNVSLEIPSSGAFALTGPSGCGKTTFLKLLRGTLLPSQGFITGLEGKKISVVFQENRLFPWFTALENVSAVSNETIAKHWLSEMELSDDMTTYPDLLSGGMQRRVALARALSYGGDIFLLDEPFQGLDNALKFRIIEKVKPAMPLVILATHDLAEAEAFQAMQLHFPL